MRTIKFRAWDYKNDKIRDWEDISRNWAMHILEGDSNTDIMQFTGLLDKSGKEIYEGDILRFLFTNWIREVKWDIKKGRWYLPFSTREHHSQSLYSYNEKEFEVIGNIYENEEFLKQ